MKKRIVLSALLVLMISGFATVSMAASKRQALVNKIATMLTTGVSGTITLEGGTQIFVSASGALATSNSGGVNSGGANTSGSFDQITQEISAFIDEASTANNGSFDPEQEFTTTI